MIIYHFEEWAINGGFGNNRQVETLHEGEKQPSKEVSPPPYFFVKRHPLITLNTALTHFPNCEKFGLSNENDLVSWKQIILEQMQLIRS